MSVVTEFVLCIACALYILEKFHGTFWGKP